MECLHSDMIEIKALSCGFVKYKMLIVSWFSVSVQSKGR